MKNKFKILTVTLAVAGVTFTSSASFAACPPTMKDFVPKTAKTAICGTDGLRKAKACGINNAAKIAKMAIDNQMGEAKAAATYAKAQIACDAAAQVKALPADPKKTTN